MLCSADIARKRSTRALQCSGPLAFESVRQQHYQTAEPVPLVFGAGDELVDDHLGTVPEVTELGFPDDQSIGAIERVTVFESPARPLR